MTHPIVKKFLNGECDAGGTIASLENEIWRIETNNKYMIEAAKLNMRLMAFAAAGAGFTFGLFIGWLCR